MTKYGILRSFIEGEEIRLSIDGIKCTRIFIKVSNRHLFLQTTEGKEEDIKLDRITMITL
mgnify:FL=1